MLYNKKNAELLRKLARGNGFLPNSNKQFLNNLPIPNSILEMSNKTTESIINHLLEARKTEKNLSSKQSKEKKNKVEQKQKLKNTYDDRDKQSTYVPNLPKIRNVKGKTTPKNDNESSKRIKEPVIKKAETIKNIAESEANLSPLEEAISNHDDGIKGNKLSVKKAYTALKDLHEKHPNDLKIKSYFGSATTLLARDASSVTDKMKYALEGLKQLDQVVEKNPDFITARILRGNVSYRLPELYFQRTATAIEDFRYLIEVFESNNSILSEREYVEILKNLVGAFKRLNQHENAQNYQEKLKAFKQTDITKTNTETQTQMMSSVNETTGEGLTEEAKNIYLNALNGGQKEVKEALSFFEVFVLTNTDPEVEMTYIDLQSMIGRDSINTYEMFGSAIKSMKAMDTLVNEHPTLSELRLIRARHSLRLPEMFFRRAAIAVSDIEMLLKDTTFIDGAELAVHHQLLFDLGYAYEKLEMLENAQEIWNKLLKMQPSEELKNRIQEKIDVHSYKEIDIRIFSVYSQEKMYGKAKEIHLMGAKGSRIAAKQSLEVWELARKRFPNCDIANTYYAASVALMGKYASDPQEMFGETIKALKMLKTSIKSNNPELKYLRGCIYNNLPEGFFHSSDKAVRDFKAVKLAYEQNSENPPITQEQYVKLLYDLGHLYKKTSFVDKALKTWKTLINEAPQSHYAQQVASQVGEEI
ncbi:hypothetical protein [Bacillus sp. J37]|uniref:hypothetical protein n=1 Tax=Bacillus sp. J37 TaxID=935837 RepID=UPI0004786DAB|nr:hypothetical protein [Bacillus sp. J37]